MVLGRQAGFPKDGKIFKGRKNIKEGRERVMKEYTPIPLPIGKYLPHKSMMAYRLNRGEKIEIPYSPWPVKGADKNPIKILDKVWIFL
jgi:hypothetical protein